MYQTITTILMILLTVAMFAPLIFFLNPRCPKCNGGEWDKDSWPKRWICTRCGYPLRRK